MQTGTAVQTAKESECYEDVQTFRMERSVMTRTNYESITKVSGDNVVSALLMYMCYVHQVNAFGYGVIDPDDFADKFKFTKHYLQLTHPDPYIRRVLTEEQIKSIKSKKNKLITSNRDQGIIGNNFMLCSSRIENAFFILANFPLIVTATEVSWDRNLVRYVDVFMRVLENFGYILDKPTGKIFYTFKLSDSFRRNLSSFYSRCVVESFVGLRRTSLEPLYAFLLNFRNSLFSKGKDSNDADSAPTFGYLCTIAGVPEYTESKYRKRDLNKAFEKVNKVTEVKFTVEWVNGRHSEKYTPIFHFDSTGYLFEGSWAKRNEILIERCSVASNEFIHNLADFWPRDGSSLYASDAECDFLKWLRSAVRDDRGSMREKIRYAMVQTFVNIGCGVPNDVERRLDRFFDLLEENVDADNILSWVGKIFMGPEFSLPSFRCETGNSAEWNENKRKEADNKTAGH